MNTLPHFRLRASDVDDPVRIDFEIGVEAADCGGKGLFRQRRSQPESAGERAADHQKLTTFHDLPT